MSSLTPLLTRYHICHKQLTAARTGQNKTMIQRQIDATDRQIDRLVYDLYGLTDKEVTIIANICLEKGLRNK